MNFKHINPSPFLTQFVKVFWILEKEYSNTDYEIVYPDGCFNLIFSFSENKHASYFTGQQTQAIKIPQSSKAKFVAVEFFPYGAFPFFNVPMSEFTNNVISAVDIFGNSFAELQEKIFASTETQSIQLIENFVLEKLLKNKTDTEQSKKASQILYLHRGILRIDQLAAAVNMTKRTLERKFEITTGLTPKAMAKIFRFNKLKNELMLNPHSNLASLAYQYNYFDQSHFIHDFKQITGQSPSLFCKGVIEKQIYFNLQ